MTKQTRNNAARIISVANQKGGVGKTALAYLLTNAASILGIKTCALDLDVQANLTNQYTEIEVKQPVMVDVIANKKKIQNVIIPLSPNLDLVPSSLKNSLIQNTLSTQPPKHHLTWFNSICLEYLRNTYELIIVDTPPHLTTLNSVFSLCLEEQDNIVIPACAEKFSAMGVRMFLDDVYNIRNSYRITSSPQISIMMNRFFQQQKTHLEMLVKMGNEFGDMLSGTIIKDSAKIREIVNNKILLSDVKHGKEVFEIIAKLLQEFRVFKQF